MSEGKVYPRIIAEACADTIVELLKWHCERVEIAGSLRRGKPEVHDIEIVCIPKMDGDLFGDGHRDATAIEQQLRHVGFTFPHFNGEHFKQFDADGLGLKCDLFITTPEQWGVIYTIRTGCADFSHKLVTPRNQGGLLPSYLRVKDGRVWNQIAALDTPEEQDFFKAIGLAWIPPENREAK